MHSEHPRAFGRASVAIARKLGVHASIAISTARRDEQFAQALASRDVIGQAKGVIMERFGVDTDRAFAMLATLSQESNTPVAQVSRKLVDVSCVSGAVTAADGEGAQ